MWEGILLGTLIVLGVIYTIWKVPKTPKWVKVVFTIITIGFAVNECKKVVSEKETTPIGTNVENNIK